MTALQTAHAPRLATDAFDELGESFRGELLLPTHEGRHCSQDLERRDRPASACIARCTGVADVVEAVSFARERDLLVAVRSGGHGVGGHALCDGGLVIDLSPMKGSESIRWRGPPGRRPACCGASSTARRSSTDWRRWAGSSPTRE